MSEMSRERRHLDRLETLIDSIYALVIVLLVAQLPNPLGTEVPYASILEFFSANGGDMIAPVIGVVLLISYWMQNNALYGNLVKTDSKHASLAIVQLLFVLLYLYSADLNLAFPESRFILAIQSSVFVLIGAAASWAWSYATKERRLLRPEVTKVEIRDGRLLILPEPLTALFTLPLAAVGHSAWNLAWLALPIVGKLVKRYGPARMLPPPHV